VTTRTCERPCCDRPHKAHGLCQSHYDRERADHRRNHFDRLVMQRARQRATQALVRTHREEWAALVEAELAQAREQAARLGEVLLRPGRSSAAHAAAARVRLLGMICPRCATEHGASHDACPRCGATVAA
jgi:hypothetical protein